MRREALILAGGLGTRLRKVTGDCPKVMAPVGNRPFLEYLLGFLSSQDFRHAVLSVGYRHEPILRHFGNRFREIEIDYAVENEPLGTGGGILHALGMCSESEVHILNGDTLFLVDFQAFEKFCSASGTPLCICLKNTDDASRYGTVSLEGERITAFREKGAASRGWINGGIYLADRLWLQGQDFPEKFSFERDFLEKNAPGKIFSGYPSDAWFIDMGIPGDYRRAVQELPGLLKGM